MIYLNLLVFSFPSAMELLYNLIQCQSYYMDWLIECGFSSDSFPGIGADSNNKLNISDLQSIAVSQAKTRSENGLIKGAGVRFFIFFTFSFLSYFLCCPCHNFCHPWSWSDICYFHSDLPTVTSLHHCLHLETWERRSLEGEDLPAGAGPSPTVLSLLPAVHLVSQTGGVSLPADTARPGERQGG